MTLLLDRFIFAWLERGQPSGPMPRFTGTCQAPSKSTDIALASYPFQNIRCVSFWEKTAVGADPSAPVPRSAGPCHVPSNHASMRFPFEFAQYNTCCILGLTAPLGAEPSDRRCS